MKGSREGESFARAVVSSAVICSANFVVVRLARTALANVADCTRSGPMAVGGDVLGLCIWTSDRPVPCSVVTGLSELDDSGAAVLSGTLRHRSRHNGRQFEHGQLAFTHAQLWQVLLLLQEQQVGISTH